MLRNASVLPNNIHQRQLQYNQMASKSRKREELKKLMKNKRTRLEEIRSQESAIKSRESRHDLVVKEVPERHIYFVLDGQDVLSSDGAPFMFSHLEVNLMLESFIDKSLWVSKAAQRMSFYELLE